MDTYATVASDEVIEKTKKALEMNGFSISVVADGEAAKQYVLDTLPKGAEVFTATSQTTQDIGLMSAIDKSGDYDAIRPKLNALMGDESKARERRKIATAPDFVVGSVHALTQDGKVLVASNTGSQLPAYTYGAGHVIWVVGAQKIVTDINDAMARLQQHVFPLENARAKVAYGGDTSINKLAIFQKEGTPGRIEIVIVKETLGF